MAADLTASKKTRAALDERLQAAKAQAEEIRHQARDAAVAVGAPENPDASTLQGSSLKGHYCRTLGPKGFVLKV